MGKRLHIMTTQTKSVSTLYQERLKRALKQCARELVRKYGPSAPPYDPQLVAQGMRVDVRQAELTGIEGYIETYGGRYVAVISTKAQETRRRFTLAHELCHVLFMRKADGGRPVRLVRFRANGTLPGLHQDPVEESLCNYFAGELLMPSDEIRGRVPPGVVSPLTILEAASKYEVSQQAAAIQVARALKDEVIACSLWNLQSLWPVPVWWTGFRTQYPSDLKKLEDLVGKKAELVQMWASYGGRKQPAKIMVTPTPAMRYAMILVVKNSN
jgi:hypothetical protein